MFQFAVPADHSAADLAGTRIGRWRGAVERFDPLGGVEGWALATDAPDEGVELELTVGEDALALAVTFEARPDLAALLGFEGAFGFRFGPETFARLARLGPRRRVLPVGVRISGTDLFLRAPQNRAPSVAELVETWRTAVLGALTPPERRLGRGERLLARLAELRVQADGLAARPLRPHSDHDVGQIDGVYPGADGQVWLVGWMKRGVEPEAPAVVVDRRKFPAGLALLRYERPDLPTSAVGIIGLMDTNWPPAPAMKEGFVFLGRQGTHHLRIGAHTRILRGDAFLAAFAQVQAVAPGGPAEAFAAVLHSGANWLPGNAAATGLAAESGVDRLLMLPGFGCFAEGWAVSPAKRVETFHMRLGDCVLVAEEGSTSFRPRPDLQAVFGGAASPVARAGFQAVLRGALPADAGGVPLLRVVHDDGSMAVSRVEPKVLRRLDLVGDGEEVLRLFPALRHEPFWRAFLVAARRSLAERLREPAIQALAPAPRALVLRLPGEPSNLSLLFDRLAAEADALPPDAGIALLADLGRGRGEALLRFHDLKAALPGRPLSLLFLAHEDDALGELPGVLSRLGAERFVHLGRGLVPTAEGWVAIGAALARRGHGLDWLEVVDDLGRPDRVGGAFTAAAFGWSAASFLEWSVTAPRFTRGLHRESGLPFGEAGERRTVGAAMRVERPRASRLADMVDEDLLAGRDRAP